MIKRIAWAILDWIMKRLGIWLDRRELERTRDAQDRNRDRDVGDADDVIDWLRDPSAKPRHERPERDGGEAGGMPPPDDEGGTEPRR